MKKSQRIASFSLAALTVAFASQLSAETTNAPVSTPIVGFQTISIVPGLNVIGPSLLNSDLLKGSVSSTSSNSISISGQTNIGSQIVTAEPYYIEVYSGSEKGARFEVNEAATISAANSSISLDSTNGFNSRTLTASSLQGATIALRKHFTIEQLQNSRVDGSGSWVGNNTPASADQILLLDPRTQSYTTYNLRTDGVTWRGSLTGTASQNKAPIPPGYGVILVKRSGGLSLTVTGSVRQNDFDQRYFAGLQLLAPAIPSDLSPAGLGATSANGWIGNNNAASADTIQVFNPVTQSYTTYNLRTDGTTWRGSLTGTTPQTSNNIIPSESGYIVKRSTADNSTTLINPIPN
ncbi:MAG: hypothetical protein EB023_12000 [Flavobacteriia bacterium]|nr:hypothetical protein [Flavobacteriia bacterium]